MEFLLFLGIKCFIKVDNHAWFLAIEYFKLKKIK
jgi:hypothetical protein